MSKSRIFLYALLSFLGGVAARSFFSVPYVILLTFVAVSAAFFVFTLRKKSWKALAVGICLLMAIVGVIRVDYELSQAPDFSDLYGKNILVQGIVSSESVDVGNYQRFSMEVHTVSGRGVSHLFDVEIIARRMPVFLMSDELVVQGILEAPRGAGTLSQRGVGGTVAFPQILKVRTGVGNPVRLALFRVKRYFDGRLDEIWGEPYAGLMKGLLLGEKASLPQTFKSDLAATGTSHIVALSGYNITIVAKSFMWVLLLATVPFYWCFWIASSGIVFFVVLTGGSASAVRAGIMGVLVLLAVREGRPYHMTNALAFAAVLMVFQNPALLRFDVGFQLSFFATMGIAYAAPYATKKIDDVIFWYRTRVKHEQALRREFAQEQFPEESTGRFRGMLTETVSAQVAVLPVLWWYFGSISLISPVTNILILPTVPYAMAAGFAAGVGSMIFGVFGKIIGVVAWLLLWYEISVVELLARVPYASIEIGKWAAILVVPLYGLFWYRVWRERRSTAK